MANVNNSIHNLFTVLQCILLLLIIVFILKQCLFVFQSYKRFQNINSEKNPKAVKPLQVPLCGMRKRKMWPDGEMVGDGFALTLILGVCNETQWQSRPALRVFAKHKVLTQLKGRFPPGRMEKWNYPCLLNLLLNFTQIITYDPMDPGANCFFLCLPLPQSPVCLVCSDRKKLFHQLC